MNNKKDTANEFPTTTPVVEEHLDDLVGFGPASLTELNQYRLRDNTDSLRIADLLRKRNDGTIALNPSVRRHLSNQYVDRLLDDALALLDDSSATPGYFYAPYNVRGRQHGGTCGIEGIKPSHHYPRALLDVMADLRGESVITNIGQCGCWSCGCAANDVLRESLEANGEPVRSGVGFSAQSNPKRLYNNYESFDEGWRDIEELGCLIISLLNRHDMHFEWDNDSESAIKAYQETGTPSPR